MAAPSSVAIWILGIKVVQDSGRVEVMLLVEVSKDKAEAAARFVLIGTMQLVKHDLTT